MNTFSEIVHDNITYFRQTLKMAKTDLVRTYRASALGWGWAVIKPVVTIFIYWFAMSIGLRGGKAHGDYPYFLWLIAGLVPWFYMNEMLNKGTDCMRKYSYLITKIHYPVSTIPTFVSFSHGMVNALLILVVYVLYCAFGFFPGVYSFQILFYMLLSWMFFTSWSLFAAPIAAVSQDFSNLVHSFVFALLWISGIFYDVEDIGNPILVKILKINPITPLIEGFRDSFLMKGWFWQHPVRIGILLAEIIIMFLLGIWSYNKLRKDMPDVL